MKTKAESGKNRENVRPLEAAPDPRIELRALGVEIKGRVKKAEDKSLGIYGKWLDAESDAEDKALKASQTGNPEDLAEAVKAGRKVAALKAKWESANREREDAWDRLFWLEETMEECDRLFDNPRRLPPEKADAFVAGLPSAMRETGGIVVKPGGIRASLRAQRGSLTWAVDFVAPGRGLVLACDAKTRLTWMDVWDFRNMLGRKFREALPEYADLPIYGAVAGCSIDKDAVENAREEGLYVLRIKGAKVLPDADRKFRAKAY